MERFALTMTLGPPDSYVSQSPPKPVHGGGGPAPGLGEAGNGPACCQDPSLLRFRVSGRKDAYVC